MAEKNVKEVKMGRGPMPRGVKPQVKEPGKLFRRILGYVLRYYKIHLALVVVCIVVSVFANVQGTMFMRTLIDQYIEPMMKQSSPDFGPLARAIGRVACFYGIGVLATFIYNRLMIYVSQGTLRHVHCSHR